MYGLRDESLYRPEPIIMHNKLRLAYPQRRSDWERPEPPGIDFAHNVFSSGIQDLANIDIKVRSEHRLCGKQYDAEMQLFHVHKELRSIENLSILIEAGGQVEGEMGWEDNPHFQILLDFFQRKFNWDAGSCARRRRRRARALFESRGKDDDRMTQRATSKLRAGSSPSTPDDEDEEDGSADDNEYPPSVGSTLHRQILDKVRSLVPRRRDAELDRWDPLEPWYMYNSIHFWGYIGSITEPPCFQDVHWRVIDVPMRISMKQYIQLKSLMFDHVDPDTCKKTSTHFEESNARPVQPWTEGSVYRCRRMDYMSDMEREISGSTHGFKEEELWMGVDNLPYVTPEFPDAG
jgi:carbonic anhydrase